MSIQYAIVTFPELSTPESVEQARRRYDPQFSLIAAHITLVFPFADSVDGQALNAHIARAVAGISCFELSFAGVTAEEGGYLFLNLSDGAERLRQLHDRLYTGVLAGHLSDVHAYRPHMTVGRLRDPGRAKDAATSLDFLRDPPLTGVVREVSLFRLDSATRGEVEFRISLDSVSATEAQESGGTA